MSDLKPCPFCGGDAEIWRASFARTAWVACMSRCAVLVSREYATDAEAIAAWNTRTTPDPLSDPRVKALVEAMRELFDGENWRLGQKFDPNSGAFNLSRQRAALRAIEEGWE